MRPCGVCCSSQTSAWRGTMLTASSICMLLCRANQRSATCRQVTGQVLLHFVCIGMTMFQRYLKWQPCQLEHAPLLSKPCKVYHCSAETAGVACVNTVSRQMIHAQTHAILTHCYCSLAVLLSLYCCCLHTTPALSPGLAARAVAL